MGSKIFREKSIERVSSPEQLDEYLRVPNVNVWVVLLILLTIALSFLVWSFAGNIVTKIDTTGIFTSSKNFPLSVRAVVSVEDAKNLNLGMQCKIYNRYSQDKECLLGHITDISDEIKGFDASHYPQGWINDEIKKSKECKEIFLSLEEDSTKKSKYKWDGNKEPSNYSFLKSGELCKVEVITESIQPINFLVPKEDK